MTVPTGRGDTSVEGSAWRPTLALAALGILSTAALTGLSLSSLPSSQPGATRTAGLASDSPAVLEGGMTPVSATVTGRVGGRLAQQPVLTQMPIRSEPGLRSKVDLGLPAILLAAPRGQVLEQTVVAPAERQLLLMRAAAPVLQVAGPLLGVDGTELVQAIAQAGAGVPVDPSGVPTLAMVAPAATPPADTGEALAAGAPPHHGEPPTEAGSGTDTGVTLGTATEAPSDPTDGGATVDDGSVASSPPPGSSGSAGGPAAAPTAQAPPSGPSVPGGAPSTGPPADPPPAPRTTSPAPRPTPAGSAPRPAPPPATPRPNTADPDPRVSAPRSVADAPRASSARPVSVRTAASPRTGSGFSAPDDGGAGSSSFATAAATSAR
ncbi:hypothetical protein [Arsenicicoccus dermatophilus]|nr:hypothetical protein [Arsenicicoccus dermatophilus]MCH8611602.1 hypothetical protein [Arsenicicoccus dermatophilus]